MYPPSSNNHQKNKTKSRSVRTGAAEARDAVPNTSVNTLGHPLEGQAAVDVLNGAGDGGLDALDAALEGRGEEADVALPAGCPLGGLVGHALLGAGHDHVEGREDADAGGAYAEDLGALGNGELGDAVRHGDDGLCFVVEWREMFDRCGLSATDGVAQVSLIVVEELGLWERVYLVHDRLSVTEDDSDDSRLLDG